MGISHADLIRRILHAGAGAGRPGASRSRSRRDRGPAARRGPLQRTPILPPDIPTRVSEADVV